MLRFTKGRSLEPAGSSRPAVGGVARMGLEALDATERAQLLECVRSCYGIVRPLTLDEVFDPLRDREREEADFVDRPIEWWDVVDAAGRARFVLWLYHADSGLLFPAGGTEHAASVVQGRLSLHGDRATWRALAAAHAAKTWAGTMLGAVDFRER